MRDQKYTVGFFRDAAEGDPCARGCTMYRVGIRYTNRLDHFRFVYFSTFVYDFLFVSTFRKMEFSLSYFFHFYFSLYVFFTGSFRPLSNVFSTKIISKNGLAVYGDRFSFLGVRLYVYL